MQAILNFCAQTGFYQFFQGDNWKCAVMLLVAIILLFLGIVKKFEPLLLVPIAIGMLVTNLPGAEMFHEILFAGGHIHWDLFGGNPITAEFIAEMQGLGVSEAVLSSVAVGQRAFPWVLLMCCIWASSWASIPVSSSWVWAP